MVVFAIHRHESAMGVHVFSHSEAPSHLPPHPIPLGCPRALALGALLHASNLHWGHVFFAFELELRHRFIQSAFLVLRPSVLD